MADKKSKTVAPSMVALFEHMCLRTAELEAHDAENTREITRLLRNQEAIRLRWLACQRERDALLEEKKTLNEKANELSEEKKTQEVRIRHLRFSIGKDVRHKDELRKERDALRNQLVAIRNFLRDDQSADTREKVLSYLNTSRLDTVVEDSTDDSIDGLEFDKTDEELIEEAKRVTSPKRTSEHAFEGNADSAKSPPKRIRADGMSCAVNDDQLGVEFDVDNEVFDDTQAIHSSKSERNRSYSEPIPPNSAPTARKAILSDSTAVLKDLNTEYCIPYSVSSPLMRNNEVSQMFETSCLGNQMHSFQKKTMLKREKCDPCGKYIKFLGECYKCRDCFATCHTHCRDRVPIPCIPFSKNNVKRNVALLIADYVLANTRPKIPAQIIHLCREIENRGLSEEGIYRTVGNEESVQTLYNEIVRPKKSLPSLSSYEISVLCSVLKKFLSGLKEPLLTRILWRDFVEAAEQQDLNDESRLITQAVSKLPTANRDSLAFLMLHWQRVANSKATKMDHKNLSTVLGPTVVGNSSNTLTSVTLFAELQHQNKIMQALFKLSSDDWISILSASQAIAVNQSSPYQYGSPDRRSSLGTLLFGGAVVHRGALTPRQNSPLVKANRALNPLF